MPLRRLLAPLILWILCLPATAQPLLVYASVPPIAEVARQVGGEHIEARSLLRPGDSPVTFSPTPRQMATLSKARLFLRVGVPFERAWLGRIQALNPGLKIVDVRRGIPLAPLAEHHHDRGGPQAGDELDPHIWTDPLSIIRIAENVRDALSAIDPEHSDDYRRRAQQVRESMQKLDAEIRDQLLVLKRRAFLVFHPAWGYFARRYELTQLAIEHEGKQAGAHWMTRVIEKARNAGIRLILIQPQFDQRLARQVAHAIGGEVATVDPLDPDYVGEIRRLVALLTKGP